MEIKIPFSSDSDYDQRKEDYVLGLSRLNMIDSMLIERYGHDVDDILGHLEYAVALLFATGNDEMKREFNRLVDGARK